MGGSLDIQFTPVGSVTLFPESHNPSLGLEIPELSLSRTDDQENKSMGSH